MVYCALLRDLRLEANPLWEEIPGPEGPFGRALEKIQVIARLPQLEHLDGKVVTAEEKVKSVNAADLVGSRDSTHSDTSKCHTGMHTGPKPQSKTSTCVGSDQLKLFLKYRTHFHPFLCSTSSIPNETIPHV